jgi:exonuclease III
VRWLESGERKLIKRRSFLYSDRDEDEDHRNGAGILVSKKANNSLIELHSLPERIITARFKAEVAKVSIVQCYAPKENAEVESTIQFY